MECIVESYLDKSLNPTQRIEKIWFALFFLRYWRQWVLLHPNYTLQNNFITNNAFKCVEYNAHALINHLLTIRDNIPDSDNNFLPWVLGSQTCERAFRAARSLSSTFSTVLNFSMLGLLRRFHRIEIQFNLHSEMEEDIVFPRARKNSKKEGKNMFVTYALKECTDTKIHEAVKRAHIEAKAALEKLGMSDLLKEKKAWDNMESPQVFDEMDDEDDDYDDYDEDNDSNKNESALSSSIQEVCSDDSCNIASDIDRLSEGGLLDTELKDKLHKLCIVKVPSSTIPVFVSDQAIQKATVTVPTNTCEKTSAAVSSKQTSVAAAGSSRHKKYNFNPKGKEFSPFVEVQDSNQRPIYIRKTTAIWLFQEGERVSSDRLFRVRSKQPFASESAKVAKSHENVNEIPYVASSISLGQLCAFNIEGQCRVGRVLHFAKCTDKSPKYTLQYKGYSTETSLKHVGVLCTWYNAVKGSKGLFQISQSTCNEYYSLSSYVCTLPVNCLKQITTNTSPCTKTDNEFSVLPSNELTPFKEYIFIKEECREFLQLKLDSSVTDSELQSNVGVHFNGDKETESDKKMESDRKEIVVVDSSSDVEVVDVWMTFGELPLSSSDRELLLHGGWLNDSHMTAVQQLLKTQFPHLNGLQHVLYMSLNSRKLQPLPKDSVQILHVNGNHWITVSTKTCGVDISVYDSMSSTLSVSTKKLLAKLVRTNNKEIIVNLRNVNKQSGSNDCALFAAAYCTTIAYGLDPCSYVYNQQQMREHLYKCLTGSMMDLFPVLRERRVGSGYTFEVPVYCYCRCPDDGQEMVCCDQCEEWYHMSCVVEKINKKKGVSWYCAKCCTLTT